MVPKFSLKSSHIEIQNFQMTSDGETTKSNVVDLVAIYNFVVDKHLKSSMQGKLCLNFSQLEFKIFKLPWRDNQNKSCRSQQYL
jgi:hypothetical protein